MTAPTLLLHRAPPAATLALDGAPDLTATYARVQPDLAVVSILRGAAVVGAGEIHRPEGPEGPEPWQGEIEIEGVRFWGTGRGVAEGLQIALVRPRCPLHVPVPGWARGMIAPRPVVEEGDARGEVG